MMRCAVCESFSVNICSFVDAIKPMRPKCGHFLSFDVSHWFLSPFHSHCPYLSYSCILLLAGSFDLAATHFSLQWVLVSVHSHRINSLNTHCLSWRLAQHSNLSKALIICLSPPLLAPIERILLNFHIIGNRCTHTNLVCFSFCCATLCCIWPSKS